MGRLIIILVVLAVFVMIYEYIARPYRILEGNVGFYEKGDVAVAIKYNVFSFFKPLMHGNIVLFNSDQGSNKTLEEVGEITAIPGDSGKGVFFLSSNKKVGEKIPSGYYVVRPINTKRKGAISTNQIKNVLWFPLIGFRQINTNVKQ